jgi:hypothetical protein
MNLKRVDLMERHKLVPSGLGSWKNVEFLGAVEDADLGFQVGQLLIIGEGAPEDLVSLDPRFKGVLMRISTCISPFGSLFGACAV